MTLSVDYGVATVDIPNGEIGTVVWFGKARDLDTSSWSAGDVLYASGTTPGELTNVRPLFPNYTMQIGLVIIAIQQMVLYS